MITQTGRLTLALIQDLGEFTIFVFRSLTALVRLRAPFSKIVRAIYEIGVRCLPIVFTVGCFTGLVLGIQGYHTLAKIGSEFLLGSTVGLSLVRELGPVLAALMIVGQAGSALAAELGIQRNSEQIDALATMGINPLGYLVGPRLIAALLVFPIHTAIFDLVGLLGGYITGVLLLHVDSGVYWENVHAGVTHRDIFGGFIKAFAFALTVTAICAFEGYNTHRRATEPGVRGVSQSTTRAVVLSCIAVLAVDYVITSFAT